MERSARLGVVNEYLIEGIHRIEGNIDPRLWATLWPLRERLGDGPVGAVGVGAGRLFIGLAKTFASAPGHLAIDVFDLKQFDLDGTGGTDRAAFEANLAASGVDNVTVLRRDSLGLGDQDAANFMNAFGGFKLFCVSGCRTPVHTLADLRFAMRVTRPEGVIAIADPLNPEWPGVGEGIARLFFQGAGAFVPLAYSCNTLLLCGYGRQRAYSRAIANFCARLDPAPRVKTVTRYGFDSLVVMPDPVSSPALPELETKPASAKVSA